MRAIPSRSLPTVVLSALPFWAAPIPQGPPADAGPPSANALLYWGDFDGDGLGDAYAVQPDGTARLLRNRGRMFEDATELLGATLDPMPTRAAWNDVDGDGALDLLLWEQGGAARLFANRGGRCFEETTAGAGLAGLVGVAHASFLDADGDGVADLHAVLPDGHRILANRGDGTFAALELELPPVDGAASVVVSGVSGAKLSGAAPEARVERDARRTGGRAEADVGPGGRVADSSSVTSVTSAKLPGSSLLGSGPVCAIEVIQDQATGTCLEASTTPTLGMLFPLSADLFVEAGTGNVGLGTTTPFGRLHVQGDSFLSGRAFVDGVGDDLVTLGPWDFTKVAGGLQINETNVASRLVLEPGGNVGIGTSEPARRLHVSSGSSGGTPTANATLAVESAGEASISVLAADGFESSLFLGNPTAGANAGALIFNPWSGPANSFVFRTADANRLTIEADGDIGIGTNPTSRLDVAGAIAVNHTPVIDASGNWVGAPIGGGSPWTMNGTSAVYDGGNVGIGTTSPSTQLQIDDVQGGTSPGTPYGGSQIGLVSDHVASIDLLSSGQSSILFSVPGTVAHGGIQYTSGNMNFTTGDVSGRMSIRSNGRIGMGTTAPEGGLSVTSTSETTDPTQQGVHMGIIPYVANLDTGVTIVAANGGGAQLRFVESGAGSFRLWRVPGSGALQFDGGGLTKVSVPTLEIRGGADIVEGFDTSDEETLEPGTVVVIDPDNAGALMRSMDAYDLKVAGVVSGAGGVEPGLHLGQESVMDGDTRVAMTGRVYVKCSAENGAIRPGDRLTTAALAGHAMKATDASRCDGAVIGKAMSALGEGTGLVLVLVNLQ